MANHQFQFGQFVLDLERYELRRDGQAAKLERQPMELLILLTQKRGGLVTRDEIIARLWGEDVFLDVDQGINNGIRKIRTALRDDPDRPRFVETVVGRGYRFIAKIDETGPGSATAEATTVSVEDRSKKATDPQTKPELQTPTTRAPVRPFWQRYRNPLALSGLAILALLIAGFYARQTDSWLPRRQSPLVRSIGVLPLENLSGDPAQDHFADGMTDELTTNLARIGSLRVISRTTMMQYRGTRKRSPEIARDLNIDALLEGSVVRSGSKVRITAQLIDARHDRHMWAQSFEREVSEILDVQDSVALDIASEVKAELSPELRESLSKHRSVKPEAYESYLMGRSKLRTQSPNAIRESVLDFQHAIDLAPLYSEAYSGLADAYTLMADYEVLSPREAFPRAEAAAVKALSLDPLAAEAHVSLGLVKNYYQWDWDGAEREFKRAIELSPSYASAHLQYSRFLTMEGRHDESIAEIDRARGLDPLSLVIASNAGHAFYYARRYDSAIEQFRQTLAIDPNRVYARLFLGIAYEQNGMYPQSTEELEKVRVHFNGTPSVALAHVYARTGRGTEARQILTQLESDGSDADWFFIAEGYAGLGDKELAFRCLEKAYQKHDFFLPWIKVDPWMDPLRSDARFKSFLRRVGL